MPTYFIQKVYTYFISPQSLTCGTLTASVSDVASGSMRGYADSLLALSLLRIPLQQSFPSHALPLQTIFEAGSMKTASWICLRPCARSARNLPRISQSGHLPIGICTIIIRNREDVARPLWVNQTLYQVPHGKQIQSCKCQCLTRKIRVDWFAHSCDQHTQHTCVGAII